MNRAWSFYDPATGRIVGTRVSCPANVDPATMAPPGCEPIEGHHDPLSNKVDLKTLAVIAFDPGPDVKRASAAASARIEELESKQGRALREAVLGLGTERLKAIDDEIAGLRAKL